ncbi:hypothetical protein J6590_031191 [Homalodisca vitripennis]|nr:hypothetical protein J6590_064810 [Homalodisca vitripennis]KAG8314129.1 hypothetical protein J6590_099353 [Homalodisca vitripennis]KAG8331947.1 hypothetical protein J6590_031191 [Homalodisca vitripennis]
MQLYLQVQCLNLCEPTKADDNNNRQFQDVMSGFETKAITCHCPLRMSHRTLCLQSNRLSPLPVTGQPAAESSVYRRRRASRLPPIGLPDRVILLHLNSSH